MTGHRSSQQSSMGSIIRCYIVLLITPTCGSIAHRGDGFFGLTWFGDYMKFPRNSPAVFSLGLMTDPWETLSTSLWLVYPLETLTQSQNVEIGKDEEAVQFLASAHLLVLRGQCSIFQDILCSVQAVMY